MQYFVNIFKIPAVILLATLFSCSGKDDIIPKKELAHIISEMYLADQYIEADEKLRAQTDTLILYEGIFNKYGYTFEDYKNTLRIYLQDGDAMYKIHIKAKELLMKERDEVKRRVALSNGKIIDWWAVDSIRTTGINDLWKYPFLRNVKWISMQHKPANWCFTDTTVYDIPRNAIWWQNNVKLNIPGNDDTLYPILTKDYLIALEKSKIREEQRLRREAAKERKEKEAKEKNSKSSAKKRVQESNLKKISQM